LIATFILWIFGTLSNSIHTYIRILHRAGRVRIHSLGLATDRKGPLSSKEAVSSIFQ